MNFKEPDFPKHPIVVDETAGTKYFCTCGLSDNQPYCDGAHKETPSKPLKVDIKENGRVAYCGCRMSDELPHCDGKHRYL